MIIEVLYPANANLYGELANIRYLAKCVKDLKIISTSLNDEPSFIGEKVDLVYMGTMTESAQELIIEKLSHYKEVIKKAIANGQHFLITGNALEVFGKYIIDEDKKIEGLGIFAFHTQRAMMKRYNSLYLGNYEDIKIVGFKSQFTVSYYDDPSIQPLFNTLKGVGFNKEETKEGIKDHNFMATYVIGPLLILNPLFTQKLLDSLNVPYTLALKDDIMANYEERLKEYSDEATGFYY